MKIKRFIVAGFLLLMPFSLIYGESGKHLYVDVKAEGMTLRVKKIYDGDTIAVVNHGHFDKVRLIGIDAPEMAQRPWGMRAKKCIETLLDEADARISLEYDVEQRDKYGRILAYVWTQDGKMINEEMLKKGCAFLFTFPPNVKYVERLSDAQKNARNNKRGLWGEYGLMERPSEYRREHPRR